MAGDEHKSFNYIENWHKGDYGCYFKHGDHKHEKCDYQLNGFNGAKSRLGMHNRDHRGAAGRKGYFGKEYQDSLEADIDARANALNQANRLKKPKPGQQYRKGYTPKDAAWKDATKARIYRPIQLLAIDEKAWYVNHRLTKLVAPWWNPGAPAQPPPSENFKPRHKGGWHYFFPYKHGHHHMIPAGALKDHVLDGPCTGKVTPFQRRLVILQAPWNINHEGNIVLLPSEEPCADIAALPAHCPWETADHPDYTDSLKVDLDKVRRAIDEAIEAAVHEKIEDAKLRLESTEEMLLEKIKRMRGPL